MSFNCTDIPKADYDLPASLKLLGNNQAIVRELALMLRTLLPEFASKLRSAFEKNDPQEIQAVAHKLHGGICYVIAPRLQYLIGCLETACKQQTKDISIISPYIIPSIEALDKTLAHTFQQDVA